MIENKLQYYQTYEGYKTQKDAHNIPNDSLVFIEDTQQIVTHGEERFGGPIRTKDYSSAESVDVNLNDAVLTVEQGLSETQKSTARANILDKETDQYAYSKLGRVILPKHVVNGHNTLTQDMFYKDSAATTSYDITIDSSNAAVIDGTTYYYEEVSLTAGQKITLIDTTHCVLLNSNHSAILDITTITADSALTVCVASTAAGTYSTAYVISVTTRVPRTDTIYVIEYDYELAEDITIPANCVLEFDGGSISGAHTITGQNTGINAGLVKIFNTDVTLAGTWHIQHVTAEWFGANTIDTDVTENMQKALDFCELNSTGLMLANGVYHINGTLYLQRGVNIEQDGRYTFGTSYIVQMNQADEVFLFAPKDGSSRLIHCSFKDITFMRNRTQEERGDDGWGVGKAGYCFKGINECKFINCGFVGFKAVIGGGCSLNFMDDCSATMCEYLIYTTESISCFKIHHANFYKVYTIIGHPSRNGIQGFSLENSWVEDYCQFYYGKHCHIHNLNIINSVFSGFAYTREQTPPEYFINFEDGDTDWRYIYINFAYNTMYILGNLVNPNISSCTHAIVFRENNIFYTGTESIPDNVNLYGDSWFFDRDSNPKTSPINKGLRVIENNKTIKATLNIESPNGKHEALVFAPTVIDGYEHTGIRTFGVSSDDKLITFADGNRKLQCMLPVYKRIPGQLNPTGVELTRYFVYNEVPTTNGDVILKYVDTVQNNEYTILQYGPKSGVTADRPTNMEIGFQYFDETLNKPIWWNGTAWVDATGATV